MNDHGPRACPHCGADPGPAVFCAQGANRVRWAVLGPLGRAAVRGGVVALALLALPVGALIAMGGVLITLFDGQHALTLGLFFIAMGAGLGWLVMAMVRQAHAVLEGHADVAFGEMGRSS